MNDVVHFVLAGVSCSLTRHDVERSLLGVEAQPVASQSVAVNGVWYPLGQALEAVTGVDRRRFRSREARRHLAQFGFEIRGQRRDEERCGVSGEEPLRGS